MLKSKIALYVFVLLIAVIALLLIVFLLRNNNTGSVSHSKVCWNNVYQDNSKYYWKDSCKGEVPNTDMFCAQFLIELSSDEKNQYLEWEKSGKILDKACNVNTAQNTDIYLSYKKPLANTYTLDELSKGNTTDNCLVAKDGSVYLIPQSYQKVHPGGANRISEQCGKDISRIFSLEHQGNSATIELLNYYIGELVD